MPARIVVIVALGVAGCSSGDDTTVTTLIAHMNSYADAQAGKADKDKLAGLEAMVAQSRKQIDAISEEDRQKLLAKNRAELDKALMRYLTAQGRRKYDVDKSNQELCDLYVQSLAGGAAPADELLKGLIAALNESADARAAKADQPAINAITCKMNAITGRLWNLKPTTEEKLELIERHKADVEQAAERYAQAQFGRSLKDMGGLYSGIIPGMPMIRN